MKEHGVHEQLMAPHVYAEEESYGDSGFTHVAHFPVAALNTIRGAQGYAPVWGGCSSVDAEQPSKEALRYCWGILMKEIKASESYVRTDHIRAVTRYLEALSK